MKSININYEQNLNSKNIESKISDQIKKYQYLKKKFKSTFKSYKKKSKKDKLNQIKKRIRKTMVVKFVQMIEQYSCINV